MNCCSFKNPAVAIALVAGAAFGLAAGFPLGWLAKPTRLTIAPYVAPVDPENQKALNAQWQVALDAAEQSRMEREAAERNGVNRRGGR